MIILITTNFSLALFPFLSQADCTIKEAHFVNGGVTESLNNSKTKQSASSNSTTIIHTHIFLTYTSMAKILKEKISPTMEESKRPFGMTACKTHMIRIFDQLWFDDFDQSGSMKI